MIGLIKGIFQRKPSEASEAVQPSEPAVKRQPNATAFFLDPDDAKTFGDINYMRTAKSIKRTFPKFGNNEAGFEKIVQISALQSIADSDSQAAKAMLEISTPTSASPSFAEAPKRETVASESNNGNNSNGSKAEQRQLDTSLDMFRSMAREIRKR
jgi:hypothetical protein